MKLQVLSLLALMTFSSAYADVNDALTTAHVVDMELNKDKVNNSQPNVVVQIHPADDLTDKELEELAVEELNSAEFQQADIIDAVKNEKEQVKQIKLEIGAEHDPINYPKFLAHVLTLDFSQPLINLEKITDGGVVVDEIPTLVDPLIISIKEAESFLHYTENEYMAVVEINGDARAYPLRVLNWHQGVNDEIGGQPVFIAYDPLSGNIFAMDRRVSGKKETTFGVTGQVYKSSSLYYDRATKSIWAPFENKAVTGALSGTVMQRYDAVLTTWKSFKQTYPDGVVMDMMNTGYDRNYRQNPYGDYASNNQTLFPVAYVNDAFPKKEYMVAVRMYKDSRKIEVAIPINTLLNHDKRKIEIVFDEVKILGGKKMPLTLVVKEPYGSIEVSSTDKNIILEKFYGYWFAISAHNPNSRIITTLD